VSGLLKRHKLRLSKKDIENLTWFTYNESTGFLASAFSQFPLSLKRHCVQVGATAGLMANYAPESALPKEMSRDEYANAVRYGSLYHDIGAYLVYNQHGLYPDTGVRILREQLDETSLNPTVRRVILETVQYYGEQYNGQGYPDRLTGDKIPLHAGICAIANEIDNIISARYGFFIHAVGDAKKYINENKGTAFSPEAAGCFMDAHTGIAQLYSHWRKNPPFWKNRDINPLAVDKSIG